MTKLGWIATWMIVGGLSLALVARAGDAPGAPDAAAMRLQAMEAMQKGNLDDAAALWDKLIALDPHAPLYRYNLACTRARQGDGDAAMAALREAVDAGFSNSSILAADTDLDSIRARDGFAALVERVTAVDPIRQMDFWVGEWDVFDAKGQRVGENIIVMRNKGRLVFEQWKDLNGWVGCSQNFFDPTVGAWRQIWTDEAGGIVEYTGKREGNVVTFNGTTLARVGGGTVGSRMTLTLNDDGSVQQVIDRQQPDGSWTNAVDFKYVKRAG